MAKPSLRPALRLALVTAALVAAAPAARAERPFDAPPGFVAEVQRAAAARHARGAPRYVDLPFEAAALPHALYVRDLERRLPARPWRTPQAYDAAFALAHDAWRATQPASGARVLIVFSVFDEGGDSLFYVPMANDVMGLGVGPATRLYDDTPDSALDGYVWMGGIEPFAAASPLYRTEAFVHEIAHRWSAYLEVEHPDLPQDSLRGRQDAHWSFFVDSGASPMEGNRWEAAGPESWHTTWSTPHQVRFSPLDLYLMGALPASEVPPFMVVDSFSTREPSWLTVLPETPPAHRQDLQVVLHGASTATVTIAQIQAANGHRVPPAAASPRRWPIAVVLLAPIDAPARPARLAAFDATIAGLVDDFADATGGRMTLDPAPSGVGDAARGAPCDDLAACDRRASDRCVAAVADEATVCSLSCRTSADCPTDECCVDVGAASICLPTDGACADDAPDGGVADAGPAPAVDEGCRGGGPAGPLLWLTCPWALWAGTRTRRRASRARSAR